MKNGDMIRLKMELSIYVAQIHEYNSENSDLSNTQALQNLIDKVEEEIDYRDTVNIHLPAVTYTEPLILHGHTINLIGSEAYDKRTTFTAGIQMKDESYEISYLSNIDFVGDGTGVAVSTAGRLWTMECYFTGWKTALLAFGNTWINATDCVFSDNEIGLHYNSDNISVSDTHFTGNTFIRNNTAVLLEKVPTDVVMNFGQCLFEANGVDIDNRCNQPIDVSEAVFVLPEE